MLVKQLGVNLTYHSDKYCVKNTPLLRLYPMLDLYLSIASVTDVRGTDYEDSLLLRFDLVPTECMSCSFRTCVILRYVISYNLTRLYTFHLEHVYEVLGLRPLYSYISTCSGFGGLEVACWPLVLKFAGSNPAEAVGFFRAKKSSAHLPSEGK